MFFVDFVTLTHINLNTSCVFFFANGDGGSAYATFYKILIPKFNKS